MKPGKPRNDRTKKVKKSPFFNFGGDGVSTSGRARAVTFVRTGDLKVGGEALTASANEVLKTKLKSRSAGLVTSTDRTVFFKKHDDMEAASQHAVASSRLARFLGMPTVIAHNAFARINKVEGVVAGKVVGEPMMVTEFDLGPIPAPPGYGPEDLAGWAKGRGLVRKDGQYYARSAILVPPVDLTEPVVQKGLSDLQLFDALSGQADRHAANIYVDPVTGVVAGIDDDWSFGQGQRANDVAGAVKKSHYVGLPALVDERTAALVLARDPDDLPAQLAPKATDSQALTDQEIADARLRLVTVQNYLRDLQARGLLVRAWDGATYQQQAAQDPRTSYLARQAEMHGKAVAGVVEPGMDGDAHYSVRPGPVVPQRPLIVNPPNTMPALPPPPAAPVRPPLIGRRAATPVIATPPVVNRNPARRRAGGVAVPYRPAPDRPDTTGGAARARQLAQGVVQLPVIGDPDDGTTSSSSSGLVPLTADPRTTVDPGRRTTGERGESERSSLDLLELSDDDDVVIFDDDEE